MSTNDVLSEVQELLRFGITQVDYRTGEIIWSDEVYRIYGYEPGSVKPGSDAALARVHPADQERMRAVYDRALRGKPSGQAEFRIVRPSGETRALQVRSRVFVDDSGAPLRPSNSSASKPTIWQKAGFT